MSTPGQGRKSHDFQNALLFLETFPVLLRQLMTRERPQAEVELEELIEVYLEKIAVLKCSGDPQ